MLGFSIKWLLFSVIASQLVSVARLAYSPPTTSISSCRWGESLTHANAGRPVCRADYPKLVDTQTNIFGRLLDESVGYDKFALEMRKAEVARKYVVETGKLNDKDWMAGRLCELVGDARGTGQSLHRLGERIQGAIDS